MADPLTPVASSTPSIDTGLEHSRAPQSSSASPLSRKMEVNAAKAAAGTSGLMTTAATEGVIGPIMKKMLSLRLR